MCRDRVGGYDMNNGDLILSVSVFASWMTAKKSETIQVMLSEQQSHVPILAKAGQGTHHQ